MNPIQIISQDVFDKIRSRFQNLEMGDESGAVTIDPAAARFFDFDFVVEGNNLGRVSISLNDLGSLKIYYSQGITENQDSQSKKLWYNFLKEMRMFAMRRLLRFDTRDIAKTNLDKNDFQYLANKNTKDNQMTNMNESRWSQRSTKKTSRAVKGTTEVIVRHNRSVDEMYPGARSQKKNIKAIFIQNKDGERFKYPFIHPAGAFAMAQHVDHGGVPHDPAGKAIMRMSEQIAQLQEFQRQVQHSQLHDDAMGIANRAHNRLMELKSMIEALGKRHHYEAWISEFDDSGVEDGLEELDPVTMEDYKNKFTQTNFKEELAKYFPLIHKIMQETDAIDLEEYVNEGEGEHTVHCSQCGGEFKSDKKDGFSSCKDHKGMKNYDVDESNSPVNEFAQFEEWAEAVEQGRLTDDQIAELRQALESLDVPLDLDTAYNFFSEFGIDDSDLEQKFQQARELDPETDPVEVFQLWAKENYPELLVALGMSGTAAPEENPSAEEPQMKEGASDFVFNAIEDLRQTNPGMDQEEFLDALYSYIDAEYGKDAADRAFSDEGMFDEWYASYSDMAESAEQAVDKSSVIKEVAKIVKQFYNKDNPEVGPFRGEEGILLDIEKQISEKFGDQAGKHARDVAEAFMEKLTNEWQERHGASTGVANDGLARLKELANVIKAKVEGIGDRGESGKDFNTNIMPAEEGKVADTVKAVGKKVLDKLGHGSDEDLIKDLQKKTGTPQTGKKPMATRNEDIDRLLKLSGLAK